MLIFIIIISVINSNVTTHTIFFFKKKIRNNNQISKMKLHFSYLHLAVIIIRSVMITCLKKEKKNLLLIEKWDSSLYWTELATISFFLLVLNEKKNWTHFKLQLFLHAFLSRHKHIYDILISKKAIFFFDHVDFKWGEDYMFHFRCISFFLWKWSLMT